MWDLKTCLFVWAWLWAWLWACSQNALKFNNWNFFTVLVDSVSSQVLYMKTVIGTQQLDNIIRIQPLSQRQMNFTVNVEIGGSLSYVYAFCTMASIKVHNIVVFTQ
ncbi:transmembrane protein 106C-like [Tachysurus fulvidraco]|uniref:transmembrane protein 106C-like n=1 Tax=Tachysurus fulvidraco TaxID=1234273 RepID=UPI001FF014C7|nr:transmembrane protein 106C-like [Tachysurus fulvidraco]